ncbi:MAG TPA: LytTR family DNA-binding domain-containing protein [Fluviicola sp.]|nr:LytTR family DNA-binding domain-containing protein [Fluviicola sp.]
MKKVLIVDDEPLARAIIKSFLQAHPDLELVGECGDGFEAAKAIAETNPDLLFLDIQMPKINGFELLEILPDPPAVIFTTAFDEYALKAFEVHALDYLLKPFSAERFSQAIEKWKSVAATEAKKPMNAIHYQVPDEQYRVVIKDGSEIKIIPTVEIHYIEAYDDYVKIHTAKGTHLKKKTMSHFETSLPPQQFIRIHRSFILNIQELTRIESFEKNSYIAILKSGARLAISRTSYADLKAILGV